MINQQQIPEEFNIFKEYLINEKNGKTASGGTQCIIRCPYCGDSRNIRNAHMYIGIDKHNGAICYHCFLCGRGGILNSDFFRAIGCFDTDLMNIVFDYNEKILKINGKNFGYRRSNIHKRINHIQPIIKNSVSENEIDKCLYINNRLGLNLTHEDLARLKIITNLESYLYNNRIDIRTRHQDVVHELSESSIGFLSVDNSHIILRAIREINNPNLQSRYNNYTIYPNQNTFLYYIIPSIVDPFRPINIYITEGVFDILGVYFNVSVDKTNSIFAAACGKTGYANMLKYIFTIARIPAFMSTVHMYSDNDVNMGEYNRVIKLTNTLSTRFILHKNNYPGEKDFGVSKDHIIDIII